LRPSLSSWYDPGKEKTMLERTEPLTSYDAEPWTDEERDRLRAEAVDALGWEGMEAYQDETSVPHAGGQCGSVTRPGDDVAPL
jgi:hypothetical protein